VPFLAFRRGREFDPAAYGTGAARPRTFATWKAEVVNVDLRSTFHGTTMEKP
jgi:hypothetical protein